MITRLSHVRNWIFDLDNTLYPASIDLFGLIDAKMTRFIQDLLGLDRDAALRLQKDYFHDHGTTLSGLMAEHGVDPHHFLDYVHDIEMDVLAEDRRLVDAVARLPGRKLIFTNGDAPYARRVLARLGLTDAFEAIHDIHACAYEPKPRPGAYQSMCAAFGIDPHESLFVEDMARNLRPAKAIGMTTVWVNNGSEQGREADDRAYIDFEIADLGEWLHEILGDRT
ncbi:pyrimidine 5'-nucleotidase [Sphingomonas changnyeongensis]|uniref:Pyrimidine 5'-nucleotidase n=1 Tax=Sphingomonas changnyeongensis TaxID=2698679 RepID=A0A7Z2NVU2_9SPHN|nr:pyrimidine 5'-nucleotidase [Sphingomonas changnyeongensis]QHL90339.1 pyrimidine 5'-nucleotidase [Sphingomonas changnyeongensis]